MHGGLVRRIPVRYSAAGVMLGILLLHPLMEAAYWFASHDRVVTDTGSLWRSIGERFLVAFTPGMLGMTGLFALIGGVLGLGFGLHASRLGRAVAGRRDEDDIATLIAAGEGERVELKASLRWDPHLGRPNRALEDSVGRTIAGLLNHEGGTLLLGVTDAGEIAGLEADYHTLRRPNRDGFQQFLMGLVETRLGGHSCTRVHVRFHTLGDRDVCRVTVEPSARPVYYEEGRVARYFVRTGNATRELDVREATEHMSRRRGQGSGPANLPPPAGASS